MNKPKELNLVKFGVDQRGGNQMGSQFVHEEVRASLVELHFLILELHFFIF